MSEEEGPKLFTNKPRKKAQVVKAGGAASATATGAPSTSAGSAAAAAASSSSKMGSPPPPPPQPPQESFARRHKFLWPLLLGVNLAVGAYLFMRTKKSDAVTHEEVTPNSSSTQVSSTPTTASVSEKSTQPPAVGEPLKIREPIPEDQQRELFKWILEERRNVKPKDPEEKKRIDEEKALLKQLIRSKSIPRI